MQEARNMGSTPMISTIEGGGIRILVRVGGGRTDTTTTLMQSLPSCNQELDRLIPRLRPSLFTQYVI